VNHTGDLLKTFPSPSPSPIPGSEQHVTVVFNDSCNNSVTSINVTASATHGTILFVDNGTVREDIDDCQFLLPIPEDSMILLEAKPLTHIPCPDWYSVHRQPYSLFEGKYSSKAWINIPAKHG
jgi:hypothetical protein